MQEAKGATAYNGNELHSIWEKQNNYHDTEIIKVT